MSNFACIYDNPKTLCREFWEDGACKSGISYVSIDDAGPAPWAPGKIIGSAQALNPVGSIQ